MAAKTLRLDAILELAPIPPEKLLPAFAKECQSHGTLVPQWNWRSKNPEKDFVYAVEQAVAPWMPAHHEDFISEVTGKAVNIETLGDRMKATKSLIWKSLGVKIAKDSSEWADPTVLKHYPIKAMPNDEEDEENPGNSSPKRRRRRKDEDSTTEEGDQDMTTKKTTAKKGEPKPKAKVHAKGSKGQLTAIGKKDWSKLPDEKKLTQGEAPRQVNSPLGKVYALLPTGKATITVGTLLKNCHQKLRMPEKKARAVIYKLVNRYHAKLA